MKRPFTPTLPNDLVVAHSAAIGTADASGAWVLLVPAGANFGRDGRGPFDAGDIAAMTAIVQATKQRAGTIELVVDYDHQSVFSAVPGVGGRAPAAGWIKDFKIEPDGIHGRIEWTELAAQAIRNREYRYISPVYQHDRAGKILKLVSAGLSNVPNFDLAVAAASAQLTNGDDMDKIAKALGLDASASEATILTAVNAALAAQTALGEIAKAHGLKDEAKPPEIVTVAQSATAAIGRLAVTVGLKADATVDDVVTAAQSATATATGKAVDAAPDPTKYVPIAQVAAMQASLKEIQDGVKSGKAEAAVDQAIKDGKLAPSLRDWGLAVHSADPGQFEAFVDKAPVLTAPQRELGKRPTADPELGEADIAVMRQMGISEDAMLAARKQETA